MDNEDANVDRSPSGDLQGNPGISLTSEDVQLARSVVTTLVDKGLKVLALDFDKTIVSVHTSGFWRGGTPRLAEHVRPCFVALIRAALDSNKLYVCVVTYSMQPALIYDVLKLVLPKCDISRIIIRANSKDWMPAQGPGVPPGVNLGKQQHIAWIVTELYNKNHAIIHPSEILLMDDDQSNIEVAQEFGHQAYEVKEEVDLQDILDYVQTIEVQRRDPPTP